MNMQTFNFCWVTCLNVYSDDTREIIAWETHTPLWFWEEHR
jgi:hypothetical protein